ncbi:unnamed protein product [Schistosoma curassoni]|uniref:Uncharacterized protein n=1 Tax=Schistosoma curassoni TaxID=6186 RepID=A0A183K9E3_9TREM|nr:unnamed protein product [Schistosoma curassoni]
MSLHTPQLGKQLGSHIGDAHPEAAWNDIRKAVETAVIYAITVTLVGGSRQETLDPGFVLHGTRQQGVPIIMRKLVLPGGFDHVSPSFTVRDVTTELSDSLGDTRPDRPGSTSSLKNRYTLLTSAM